MDIQANLKEVIAELPTNVRLVAVSKFHPAELSKLHIRQVNAFLAKAKNKSYPASMNNYRKILNGILSDTYKPTK